MICGRYEGVDERVFAKWRPHYCSIGDFVLSGGEIAAMALLDAVVRLLPGVTGDRDSLEEESFCHNLLEYPHYTRPAVWDGVSVPPVLLSGDHKAIAAWRRQCAQDITRQRRPDLWARYMREIAQT